MKKFTKLALALGATVTMAITPLTSVFASSYTVNKEFRLDANEGDSRRTSNKWIVLHETANPTATGRNEATYMNRNWRNAYTSHIVGDGIVYEVGQKGYMQYGAASYEANIGSYAQIELQHTNNKELFAKNYKVYINLARDLAKEADIPLTLDTPYPQKGIKTHQWMSLNIAGDHLDPYAYLNKMGITKAQLAHDLKNGFSGNNPAPKPDDNKPVKKDNRVFEVGSQVQVRKTASKYQTGQTIPNFVKGTTYKVLERKSVDQSNSLYAYRLAGINSWLLVQDLDKASNSNNTPAPQPTPPKGVTFYSENATFTPSYAMNVRSSASLSGSITGTLPAGYSIRYNAAGKDSKGYVWVRYQAYNGIRYVAVRHNGVPYGTFK